MVYEFNITSFEQKDLLYYKSLELFMEYVTDSNDILIFNIHSPGGNVAIGLPLLRGLRSTDATTIGIVPDYTASLGAVITMPFDRLIMEPNSLIMFHKAFYITPQGLKHIVGDERQMQEINDSLDSRILPMMTPFEQIIYKSGGMIIWTGEDYMNKIAKLKSDKMIENQLANILQYFLPPVNDLSKAKELYRRLMVHHFLTSRNIKEAINLGE